VTLPPGELMYRWMGLDESSASRNSSCATVSAESLSCIYARMGVSCAHMHACRVAGTHGPVEHDDALAQQTREDVVRALAAALCSV
jgi:hypothetical protein